MKLTATYLSRIVIKIQPIEKILDDSKFFLLALYHLELKCTDELLKFKTKNDQVYGLTTINGNKIIQLI
jgi:hypothetical protein